MSKKLTLCAFLVCAVLAGCRDEADCSNPKNAEEASKCNVQGGFSKDSVGPDELPKQTKSW
ncbi:MULTISPECIES: hypothetical protein [Pseudomonas]|uniref:hypothetical protein n=1 Tax=Pseudomonas TaxID=286 RepID=UPI0023D83518|nr:hypothetical protein [Pseudomonas sp. PSE14]WEJ71960.1 hypothetical protein O6P39_25485 [Pseudomonas sp. PSE14]